MKKTLLFLLCACALFDVSAQRRQQAVVESDKLFFNDVFAPQEGYLRGPEKGIREEICLNGKWDFQPVAVPSSYERNRGEAPVLPQPTTSGWDNVKIRIPSPWNANSFAREQGPDHYDFPSYPKEWENVEMGWLRKEVDVPSSWTGKQIKLHFEAVAGFAEVYVNGKKVAENFDIFLPFDADITDAVTPGQKAEVLVGVRSYTLFDKREKGGVGRRLLPAGSMWGIHIAGIWQDVFMVALPKVNIENVYIRPNVSKGELTLDVKVRNNTSKAVSLNLTGDVREWINKAGVTTLTAPLPLWELGGKVLDITSSKVTVEANSVQSVTVTTPVADGALEFWTPEYPNLYGLTLSLGSKKATTDVKYERFGWREWTIEGNKYLLNGKPIELKGDAWHFMGIPQLTRRYAWAWFTAIKAANGNAVRPHAQVYPQFYLDVADEMGICVLAETAIWASDGGPKMDSPIFWEAAKKHVERMVLRDRNHASIFGWSISNENKPVILHVFNRPDLMPAQVQAWKDWSAIVRENDPTRPWISSDGEDDGDGVLPITLGHYGNENSMKHWAGIGKPWGVGEHSMAYYGTPQQVSVYNGEDAYLSQEKRMEGLANECYNLILNQRKYGASYIAVFNIAWYALQPLPFGMRDTGRAPSLQDGVYFTHFKEGEPGVQPERLGPYSSTFNPGYDPTLPLYIPWAMFDAIRAANAAGEPAWSKWANVEKASNKASGKMPEKTYKTTLFLGYKGSEVKTMLENQGVKFADKVTEPASTMIVVDGATILNAEQTEILKDALAKGADMWLVNPVPKVMYFYNEILPAEVELRSIAMSSFIPQNVSWTDGMQNSEFYFCEVQRDDAANYAFVGDFVKDGQVLLVAPKTDWRRWNQRAEATKTASILRSEREDNDWEKVVMARYKDGNSTYYVSTLSNFANTDKGKNTLAKLLTNSGIQRENLTAVNMEGMFDDNGHIMKVLRSPLYTIDPQKGGFAEDFVGGESNLWQNSAEIAKWTPVFANQRAVIDDQGMGAVYYSFWVLSPRDLTDLLIEPNMPKVDFTAKTEQGADIWLNGEKIGNIGAPDGLTVAKTVPMKQGWNNFIVKVLSGGGSGRLTLTFSSENKPEFIKELHAALSNPDAK